MFCLSAILFFPKPAKKHTEHITNRALLYKGSRYPQDSDFFNCRRKAQNAMTPGILNSQKIKSDFNSKMLNFDISFTSY